jgi:predicted enzyme related to lactoylglutathione lyase
MALQLTLVVGMVEAPAIVTPSGFGGGMYGDGQRAGGIPNGLPSKGHAMQLRLLEIELYTDDPEGARRFYGDQLALDTHVDGDGLKVFGSGIPDLDLIKSPHFPGRVSIAFYAEDVQACAEELNRRGVEIVQRFGNPVSALVLRDPDGCRVEIKRQHG